MALKTEHKKAAFLATMATLGLAGLIVLGSRNLAHFDAALIGYTFATLFAAFGVTYRYSMWLQRPPTGMLWRRGWQVFFRPGHLAGNLRVWFHRVGGEFMLNEFIYRRGLARWAAHMALMWGCTLAAAITFPLVFGWLHFESLPGDVYQIFVFGFPTITFPIGSLFGFLTFHGLVWASFLVMAGVMLAFWRRVRDHGAAATQQFAEDFLPLILLFSVSVTGLMLTASYTWMHGYAYDFLAYFHAVTVIFTLLWLPFGKFFHIFQRPAQLGVSFYQEVGRREGQARCRRCHQEYAPAMQVQDLQTVERELGFDYTLESGGHYQEVCPACRRRLVALTQGRLWKGGV